MTKELYFDKKRNNWVMTDFRSSKIWTFFKILLVVFTTSGFLGFICEETMQITTFGAFAYSSSKDWQGLESHLENVMKPVHRTSESLIYLFGWLNPVMYPAYISYLKANEGYINSIERKLWVCKNYGCK